MQRNAAKYFALIGYEPTVLMRAISPSAPTQSAGETPE